MKFFVAVTDEDWFNYLSAAPSIDEVNFWQPGGKRLFRSLAPGEPFLFKLHSPRNYIVGGGFFGYSTILPASFAWETFGIKNGAASEAEMRSRIARYRRAQPSPFEDYQIGCILLQSPFFFRDGDWIPASDWAPTIVQGKTYDTAEGRGLWLWQQVEDRLKFEKTVAELLPTIGAAKNAEPGSPQIVFPRLGQGSFRVVVTDAYDRRCAVTQSPVLHVLDAAHIRPYGKDGPTAVNNGILLRQDVHTLFDRGYITVTADHHVEVSRRIRDEFDNGREYYALHGNSVPLPKNKTQWPSAEFLTWHNENVYRG
jgi:putative restriction endonuclease